MNGSRVGRIILAGALSASAIIACAFPGVAPGQDLNAAASQTLSALATISAGTLQAGGPAGAPSDTPVPPVAPTASPTVVHLVRPDRPGSVSAFLTDRSSLALAAEHRSIADNFNANQLERPFTSQIMDYQGYLDLTGSEWSASGIWYYVTFQLEELPPAGAGAMYAVELDLDVDGRGDWLVIAAAPSSSDWTTDGVRVLEDSNHDVGGSLVLRPDAPPQLGNGYDHLVFDSQGPDPDAAWVRVSPSETNQVEIAFKSSLIGADNHLTWGVWADAGAKEPAWFDYHDHFTLNEAGSPLSNVSDYPLKSLASVDSTCRWGYGFHPLGTEPGVCPVPVTPTPTATRTKTPTPTPTDFPPIP
jgi:hypothetical protein